MQATKRRYGRSPLSLAAGALAVLFFSTILSGCGFGWLYMRVGDSHRIKGMKILSYDKTQKRFRNARDQYKTAIQYYDDSILYDEMGNPEVYFKCGETHLLLDPPDLDNAQGRFEDGLKAMRKSFDMKGITSADRVETTSSGLQWVNTKDATYAQLHGGLGMLYYLRGVLTQDQTFFGKAMEALEIADTVSPRALKSETGFMDKVLDWFDLTELITPTPIPVLMAQVLNYRGKLALNKGMTVLADSYFKQAEENLDRAKSLNPRDTRLLAEYTRLYYLTGQYDKASQYLEEILATNVWADKVNYSILKGNIFNETKKYDEAIAIFSDILELDPTNTAALIGRSTGYAHKGDTTSALGDLEVFLAQDTKDPQLFLHAGRIYNILKQFTSAEEMYLKAFYVDANDIEINYELGKLYRALGKKAEMDARFRKVMQLGPTSSYAKEVAGYVGK